MTIQLVVTESTELTRTKVPALPFGPVEYDRQYQDQLNNILRQYFNTLDNFIAQLSLSNGTNGLPALPHIAAQYDGDQRTTTNTATKVLWNTLDSGYGFTLNIDSTATPTYTGVYKIDFSLQLVNDDNVAHNAYVWLKVDGVDVVGSASKFSVPARKSAGNNSYVVAYSSVTFSISAGSSVALYWATSQAATLSPAVDGIYLESYPVQTTPFAMPSIPSAIGSIVFVSGPTA
jgi:hypothetical protein